METKYTYQISSNYLPTSLSPHTKAMTFIDGENLTIRYQNILADTNPQSHVYFKRDIYVWTHFANIPNQQSCKVLRRYYYTSVQGDAQRIESVIDELIKIGIEAPRVFKKFKNKRSKRVDITLATEMLGHAHRKNYDIAILIAGDEDYVPLVEAVKAEGCRVVLWFFERDLSPNLRRAVDFYFDIGFWFFGDSKIIGRHMYLC